MLPYDVRSDELRTSEGLAEAGRDIDYHQLALRFFACAPRMKPARSAGGGENLDDRNQIDAGSIAS
jgi:hypothetical protein